MRFHLFLLALVSVMKMWAQNADPKLPSAQLSIDSLGKVTICIGDSVNGKVFLQQFKWNRWINIDTTIINGNLHDTCFNRNIVYTYSPSKFRVKIRERNDSITSDVVTWDTRDSSKICGIQSYHCRLNDKIEFGCVQKWEVYDQYGNIVKRGVSKEIDTHGLPKGGYFVNYDNFTGEFFIGY